MKTTRIKPNVRAQLEKNSFLVPFKSDNPPHGITCLSFNKCVVMYDTKCVIINLKSQLIQEVIDFGTQVNEIVPMRNGFLAALFDSQQADYLFIQPGQQTKQYTPAEYTYNNLIYFSESNTVCHREDKQSQQITCLKNQKKLLIKSSDTVYKGDDKEWLVLGNKYKKWRFKSVLTGQQRIFPVVKTYWKVYLINENSAIGIRSCDPLQKNIFIAIDKITEGKQNQAKQIIRLNGYRKGTFGWMNTEKKTVMIMLLQPKNALKWNVTGQVILLNYENGQIIWRQITDITYKTEYRMSPQFDHFVEIKQKGDLLQIIDYPIILSKE